MIMLKNPCHNLIGEFFVDFLLPLLSDVVVKSCDVLVQDFSLCTLAFRNLCLVLLRVSPSNLDMSLLSKSFCDSFPTTAVNVVLRNLSWLLVFCPSRPLCFLQFEEDCS